jgi:hypothetical protein
LQAIVALALLFIVVYFVGSYRNRRLAVAYGRMIKEHMSPRSKFVGFRPYGHSGLRSVVEFGKDENRLAKIEIAITLADRENVMHYPLSLLTRETDRVVCWAFPKTQVDVNVELVPRAPRLNTRKLPRRERFRETSLARQELAQAFVAYSDDAEGARRFLSNNDVETSLVSSMGFLKRISVDKSQSWIYLMGELRAESLRPFLDLAYSCGRAFK